MNNLQVNITGTNKSYPIYINNTELSSLKLDVLAQLGDKNYIVVMSKKIHKLYSKLLNFSKDKVLVLPDGESQKNYKNYLKILDFALKNKLTRQDAIIAIGGGVVGDITGFAASSYMRGIDFIQIPTTLLAAVDSSVGGKTAINTKFGKNLIGAFYQPKAVFINVNFLKTLDNKQFKSGLGEVIKYGFIEQNCNPDSEAGMFNFLSANKDKILAKDTLVLKELIKKCVELKIAVVQKDEKESGLRKILNYGHTYGHAIETITSYKKYTHGECVIEGINFALKLALYKNLIDKEYKFLCEDLIKKFGYSLSVKFPPQKIISVMKHDKKATKDSIKFILPIDYAKVQEVDFTEDELKTFMST